MQIRKSNDDDLESIFIIQSKNPQAAQWARSDYANLARDPLGLILVAELDATISPAVAGFAAFHRVMDEAEIRNMAVDPAHQRQGVGRQLLVEARRQLLEQGVRRVFLEVRASNLAAQQLYYSAGFGPFSRRRDYYSNPREDGLVLSLTITPPLGVSPTPGG